MSKVKIIVVDDHKIIRDGLSAIFMVSDKFELVGETDNEQELKEILSQVNYDVIIMDIALPGKSGLELSEDILIQNPNAKILILSSHIDEENIEKAIEVGVKGFVLKETDADVLLEAIDIIASGKQYFSPEISNVILSSYRNVKTVNRIKEETNLTPREMEVLKLFAEGLSYKQIADKLFISVKTVDTHKRHIQEKLKLNSTVDIVKYAIKNKFIKL
jgi:DNA-binding NarL/FixJ family response regulator